MRCLSSSSTAEIIRRTSLLFKNVDKLKQLALSGRHTEEEDGLPGVETDTFSHAGMVLHSLTEFNVRSMCGEAVYGAGLQNYTQGRVSDMKFSKNTLSGKLDESGRKWLSSNDPQYFEPMITLERNSKRPRISGGCACSLASEGSLCTHMAALMIAWVRKPQDFVEAVAGQGNRSSRWPGSALWAHSMKWSAASKRVVRGTTICGYFRKRTQSSGSGRTMSEEANTALTLGAKPDEDLRPLIREFSETLNSVSFALMSAIESKYTVGATNLYNTATVSTFARVLELFVENERKQVLVRQEKKRARDIAHCKELGQFGRELLPPLVVYRTYDKFNQNVCTSRTRLEGKERVRFLRGEKGARAIARDKQAASLHLGVPRGKVLSFGRADAGRHTEASGFRDDTLSRAPRQGQDTARHHDAGQLHADGRVQG